MWNNFFNRYYKKKNPTPLTNAWYKSKLYFLLWDANNTGKEKKLYLLSFSKYKSVINWADSKSRFLIRIREKT